MEIFEMEQGGLDWFKVRAGVPSGSNFCKIVTSKGDPSKSAKEYMYRLVGEAVSGISEESYKSKSMQRGNDLEEEARQLYEIINDVEVRQVGFCKEGQVGCSPDGLVSEDGMIEIKCLGNVAHVDILLKQEMPIKHFQQIQGQLLVTGRKWCDFFSYSPGLKPFCKRIERDEVFLAKLKTELKLFCLKLEETINKIK